MNRVYLILIMFLLVVTTASAQQSPVIGTWELDLSETIALMDNTVKQTFNNLDQSVKDRMEVSMGGRTFSFDQDGSVTANWKSQGNPRVSTGTWEINGQTLTMTFDGDVQQYTFEVTTNSHLVLSNTTPSGFFSNLYLTWKP